MSLFSLIHWMGELSGEKAGAAVAGIFVTLLGAVAKSLAKSVTERFLKKDREVEALNEYRKEAQVAADDFAKDAEILRLRRALEASERQRELLESHVQVLEDAKLDLELQLAQARVERATGKHKALPPAVHDLTDQLDTERPRSGAKKLPPLPTSPAPTRPKK
jgi:hypothetical protein